MHNSKALRVLLSVVLGASIGCSSRTEPVLSEAQSALPNADQFLDLNRVNIADTRAEGGRLAFMVLNAAAATFATRMQARTSRTPGSP